MEWSCQIVEFSACSVNPRAGKAGDYLFMAARSMESFPFSSYQEVLQGTAGHCFFLRKWALGNLQFTGWCGLSTAMGTVPVDIQDCLLWPCRRACCEMWLGQTWPAQLLATDQHIKHKKLAQVNYYVHSNWHDQVHSITICIWHTQFP